jgi:hypothetical protein
MMKKITSYNCGNTSLELAGAIIKEHSPVTVFCGPTLRCNIIVMPLILIVLGLEP